MIYKLENPQMAAALFGNWQETLIWSCLQNVMGEVYADETEEPRCAMALIGDFCFLAGEPKEELVSYKPENCKNKFIIMIPQTKAWEPMIESCYKEKAKKTVRYAIKKEPFVFDTERLQETVDALSTEYTLKMMDEECFFKCREISWCRDFVSQYRDYEQYQNCGLGAVILKDGEVVAGASSYISYKGGIEIEIDTREDFRRRGLAYVCASKLILECLARGWYPSWDAQNLWSIALAEKLGYHFDHTYTVYEIYEF